MDKLTLRVILDLLYIFDGDNFRGNLLHGDQCIMDVTGSRQSTKTIPCGTVQWISKKHVRINVNITGLKTWTPGKLWLCVRDIFHRCAKEIHAKETIVTPRANDDDYDAQFVWDFLRALDLRALNGFVFGLRRNNRPRLRLVVAVRRTNSVRARNVYKTVRKQIIG